MKSIYLYFIIVVFVCALVCTASYVSWGSEEDYEGLEQMTFTVSADDDTEFIARQKYDWANHPSALVNNFGDKRYFNPFGFAPVTLSNDTVFWGLHCSKCEQILTIFGCPIALLENEDYFIQDWTLELKKIKEYDNVVLYGLSVISGTDGHPYWAVHQNKYVWLDNNLHTYCGGLGIYHQGMNRNDFVSVTEKGQEYYNYLKDMLIELALNINKLYAEKLETDNYTIINDSIRVTREMIATYEPEVGQKIFDDYNNMYNTIRNKLRLDANIRTTESHLYVYTSPVSEARQSNLWRPEMLITKGGPNIEGELPVNDEEFAEYVEWLTLGFTPHEYADRTEPMMDIFGTKIKLELVPEGVKATSAGPDKEFGTDDDIVFIRTYESVGMERMN